MKHKLSKIIRSFKKLTTLTPTLSLKWRGSSIVPSPLREKVRMRVKKLGKKTLAGLLTFILVILPVTLLILFNSAKGVEAAWANEDWGYRYPITITNSTGAVQTNLQKLLTIDTSTLVTAGKLQSDCDDLRFTAQNGTVLPYYIDSGCNTTTTKVWVLIDTLPTNGSVIYMYYGNSSINAGSSSKEFDNLVGLAGYWTLNETAGSTAADSSVNSSNGTVTGTTTISAGNFGNARTLSSPGGAVEMAEPPASTTNLTNGTIIAWIKTSGAGNSFRGVVVKQSAYSMFLGGDGCASDNNLTLYDWSTSTTRCSTSGSLADNTWHMVAITFQSGVPNGTTFYVDGVAKGTTTMTISSQGEGLVIGSGGNPANSQLFLGEVDDIHIYNTVRTAAQISSDYTKTYTIQTSPLTVTTASGSEEKAPSPVAYWKFDDATGTTAQDSTTNNNDGTLTNSPTWQTEDMCVSGKCLFFDGTDDNVTISSPTSLNITGTNPLTFQAWIRTKSGDASEYYIFDGHGATPTFYGYAIRLSGGKFGFYSDGSGWDYQTTTINDGKWHHIAASVNGGTVSFYLDGKPDGSATGVNITSPGSISYTIGYSNDSNQYFPGFIDEPKIYNYARSSAQILADYNSRSANEGLSADIGNSDQWKSLSNGLVGYWKMDQSSWNGTAGEVIDSSGIGTNGTAVGNATTAGGKFGNGGTFDGTGDYVTIGSVTGNTSTQTVATWIYVVGAVSGNQYIIDQGGNNNWIQVYQSRIRSGNSGSYYCDGATTITANTWYHVAKTFDGTTIRVYLNGVQDCSIAGVGNTPGAIRIGDYSGGGLTLNGKIDETRLYNRALSPAEVSQLYNFAPGPVASYNFDENTGSTVNDRSGNANTGTWNGSGSPHWKPGKNGAGGNFDGSSDYVDMGDVVDPNSTSLTLEAWLKTSSTANYNTIIRKGSGGANDYLLRLQQTTGYAFIYYVDANTNVVSVTGTKNLADGAWHHVVGILDRSGNVTLYVDGVIDGTPASATSLGNISNSVSLNIGRKSDGGEYFNGQIDDVKVYNYARTQQQIIEDMLGGGSSVTTGGPSTSSGRPSAPVGYWRFDEGYGTTANNVGNGGTALNGTLTGMSSPATSTSGWTQSGKFNKALNFDGVNDYVSAGITAARTNILTVSAWIKPTAALTSRQDFIASGNSSNYATNNWIFSIKGNTGTNGSLEVLGSSTNLDTGANVLVQNSWNHVGFTSDGTTVKIYVNGSLSTSGTLSINNNDTTGEFIGGSSSAAAGKFAGQIDEVKIYPYALTADQVKLDMNQGAAQVVGSLGNLSTLSNQAAGQEYCVPGDTTSCATPVGRWDFDEATGTTANDSSGNANTGTLTNGPTWKPGKVNKSLSFDGSDDYVEINPSANTYINQTGNDTISTWIRPSSFANFNLIIDSQSSAGAQNDQYNLYLDINGKVNRYFTTYCTSNTALSVNNWHHILSTYDGTNIRIYINGILDKTCAQTKPTTTTNVIRIGARAATTFSFSGQIDQVRVFNYARTAAQIAWDYNKGAPVGHWRLDECQGTSAKDVSGNNNTGTITIGSSGTQTTAGTCTDGSSASAWYNGVSGKKNYSLNFDGTDDKVDIIHNSSISFSLDFTISSWIKTTTNNQVIMAKNGSSTNNYMLYTGVLNSAGTTNKASFRVFDTAAQTITGTTTINDGNWHHIMGIRSGNNLSLYVDGKLDAGPTSFSLGTITNSNNVTIGYRGINNDAWFTGQIDDVRIYNYGLTATQVKTLFSEGAYRSGPSTGAP